MMSLLIDILPAEIVVVPVYVLSADTVSVDEPVVLFSTPAPEITPDNVCVADDAKVNVPALEIAPL